MKAFHIIFWSIWAVSVIALSWLWIRSYSTSDGVYHCNGKGNETHVYVCQGRFIWRCAKSANFMVPIIRYYQFDVRAAEGNIYIADYLPSWQTGLKNWIIFHYGAYPEITPLDAAPNFMGVVGVAATDWFDMPIWTIAIVLLVPILWVGSRKLRRRASISQNFCPTCRYDLRAHHPGEKCPECGTIIPSPSPR